MDGVPDDFDPVAAGLTEVIQPKGDFDANGVLELADLEILLLERYCNGCTRYGYWKPKFDLQDDAKGDYEDIRIWVEDVYGSRFGDANLDGDVGFEDFLLLSMVSANLAHGAMKTLMQMAKSGSTISLHYRSTSVNHRKLPPPFLSHARGYPLSSWGRCFCEFATSIAAS